MTILDPNYDELATLKQELRLSEQDRFELLAAINVFIDEACDWLYVHQKKYIVTPGGVRPPYISGRMQTDLRAHLEKFVNSYRTNFEGLGNDHC